MKEILDFYKIVKKLRKECPWDKEQTLDALLEYLAEEVFETIGAKEDLNALKEELGDVLLVLFMIFTVLEEKGVNIDKEIIEREKYKMIKRHPHIFGKSEAKSAEDVLKQWEKIKGKKWKVDHSVPALLTAYKMQDKAKRMGFDWKDVSGVFEKMDEEINELNDAENEEDREEEFGDVLFVCAHLGNFYNINPEIALHKACEKFSRRFELLEKMIKEKGLKDFKQMEMDELNKIWEDVKRIEAQNKRGA